MKNVNWEDRVAAIAATVTLGGGVILYLLAATGNTADPAGCLVAAAVLIAIPVVGMVASYLSRF